MKHSKIAFLAFLILLSTYHDTHPLNTDELKSELHLPVPNLTFQEKLKCTVSIYLDKFRDHAPHYNPTLAIAGISTALYFGAQFAPKKGIQNSVLRFMAKPWPHLGIIATQLAWDYLTAPILIYFGGLPNWHPSMLANRWLYSLKLDSTQKNKLLELPFREFAEKVYGPIAQQEWENHFQKHEKYFHMLLVKQAAIEQITEFNQRKEEQLENTTK